MADINSINVIRDRSVRLFTFLRQLAEMRAKAIRTVDKYDQVIWLSNIPRDNRHCDCVAWTLESGTLKDCWLWVKKPIIQSAPPLSTELSRWVLPSELRLFSKESPDISNEIVGESEIAINAEIKEERKRIFLKDYPAIQSKWEAYLEKDWKPWAEKMRILSAVQQVYSSLFAMYQRQQRMGEAYEVVLGLGLLFWHPDGQQEIKRHLIVAQTEISFNPTNGEIAIGPSPSGVSIALEQDMIEPQFQPDVNEIKVIEAQMDELGSAIWANGAIHSILKTWVNSLPDSQGYDEALNPPAEITERPRVVFAPAIILRKRSERSLIRCFQDICSQLESGGLVAAGIEQFVRDPDIDVPQELIACDVPLDDWDTYFPLPANEEQKRIAELIRTKNGVLVQGPPGTGKSQTIANLICHLLATGKKVLVTSHAARALTVLKNKIPEEVRQLCILNLANDKQELEGSVRGITAKHQSWKNSESIKFIKELSTKIDTTRRDSAHILAELRAIREKETYRHSNIAGSTYSGSLMDIAKRINDEELQFNWISSNVQENADMPLSNHEASKLISLLRGIDKRWELELELAIADPQIISRPGKFDELVNSEKLVEEKFYAFARLIERPEYDVFRSVSSENRIVFINAMRNLCREHENRMAADEVWIGEVSKLVIKGRAHIGIEILERSEQHLIQLDELVEDVKNVSVTGIETRDNNEVKVHAQALLNHLAQGGKLGFWILRPSVVKDALYLIKEMKVNGRPCDSITSLSSLVRWITAMEHLKKLQQYWCVWTTPMDESRPMDIRRTEFRNNCTLLKQCLRIEEKYQCAVEASKRIVGLRAPKWHDINDLTQLADMAEIVKLEEELVHIKQEIENNIQIIQVKENDSKRQHGINQDLIEALKSRNIEQYSKAYNELCNLAEIGAKIAERESYIKRLEEVMAIECRELIADFINPIWDDRLKNFEQAWYWKKINIWLKRMSDPDEEKRLRLLLEKKNREHQADLALLAAEKAWQHCLSRLTQNESQHLRSWEMSVGAYGKGTGPHANRHLRDAQAAMDKCRGAIPAWVMPIYRVAETISMKPEIFDVVIVDEASQSGAEALFLQYIAKQVVVVGDEKQISPSSFLDQNVVELLRQRLIADIPHSESLSPKFSFFDQAFIRYESRIQLREHFRCMPEIIQFSNNLCYSQNPLIPLKQFGSGRLSPTIKTVYIKDGYQKGASSKALNNPEAMAIADAIEKCCKDERYKEKTMGVISLLGDNQAKLILQMLTERLSAKEITDHDITCGDAYAFQGDERDVMFLSMVSAPSDRRRVATIAGATAERRFNVAASRAKEQMWLFHSFTLSEVSPRCLRHALLKYCLDPVITDLSSRDLDLAKLQRESSHDRFSVPDPFDSWFEVDVYLHIKARGYRVIPQYSIAGYKIDLMVMGMKGCLAVECDGDEWHGPDKYDEDMSRQRQMERSGCIFWRIRGGIFYRNPCEALEDLWDTLESMKIFPKADKVSPMEQPKESEERNPNGSHYDVVKNDNEILEEDYDNTDDHSDEDIGELQEVQVNGLTHGNNLRPLISDGLIDTKKRPEQIELSGMKAPSVSPRSETGKPKPVPPQPMPIAIKPSGTLSIERNKCSNVPVTPDCLSFLQKKNMKFADYRTQKGTLWIVGGPELEMTISELGRMGFRFKYAPDGYHKLGNKPAWFLTK